MPCKEKKLFGKIKCAYLGDKSMNAPKTLKASLKETKYYKKKPKITLKKVKRLAKKGLENVYG